MNNTSAKTDKIKLSDEQQHILDLIVHERKSVFFTGAAGTGKSFLLKRIVESLPASSTFVTASTGIAAVNIEGTTLHNFVGAGLCIGPISELVGKIKKNRLTRKRWIQCRVLIVDEISMVSGPFFDTVEEIARLVRGSKEPFGGIQLVLCGDFLQLPPVEKKGPVIYSFEARSWGRCVQHTVRLNTVFRQQLDTDFIRVLTELRSGKCSEATEKILRQRVGVGLLPVDDDVLPTLLFCRNVDVDRINYQRLQALEGKPLCFTAKDHVQSPTYANALEALIPFKVMLLKNVDVKGGLSNGSRGVVVGFVPARDDGSGAVEYPQVKWAGPAGTTTVVPADFELQQGDRVVAKRVQVPLRLAWALTIHKSQGMTLDKLEIDLSGVFEGGQTYVALSRGVALNKLQLSRFNSKLVFANYKALSYDESLGAAPTPDMAASASCPPAKTSSGFLLSNVKSSETVDPCQEGPSGWVMAGSDPHALRPLSSFQSTPAESQDSPPLFYVPSNDYSTSNTSSLSKPTWHATTFSSQSQPELPHDDASLFLEKNLADLQDSHTHFSSQRNRNPRAPRPSKANTGKRKADPLQPTLLSLGYGTCNTLASLSTPSNPTLSARVVRNSSFPAVPSLRASLPPENSGSSHPTPRTKQTKSIASPLSSFLQFSSHGQDEPSSRPCIYPDDSFFDPNIHNPHPAPSGVSFETGKKRAYDDQVGSMSKLRKIHTPANEWFSFTSATTSTENIPEVSGAFDDICTSE